MQIRAARARAPRSFTVHRVPLLARYWRTGTAIRSSFCLPNVPIIQVCIPPKFASRRPRPQPCAEEAVACINVLLTAEMRDASFSRHVPATHAAVLQVDIRLGVVVVHHLKEQVGCVGVRSRCSSIILRELGLFRGRAAGGAATAARSCSRFLAQACRPSAQRAPPSDPPER